MSNSTNLKIEVKSAAYIQSWKQKTNSKISFSIAPSRGYSEASEKREQAAKRQADVYVFCHLKHKDRDTINPLKMEQWDFYVVPTILLDTQYPTQASISLNPLKKLTQAISYSELARAIEECQSNTYSKD